MSHKTSRSSERKSDSERDRKRCVCGPYLDLIQMLDNQDSRDLRSGRAKKSPDMIRFGSALKLASLDLQPVVKFLIKYEEKRGNHPDLIFGDASVVGGGRSQGRMGHVNDTWQQCIALG